MKASNKITAIVILSILIVVAFSQPLNADNLVAQSSLPTVFFDDTDVAFGTQEWELSGTSSYYGLWNTATSTFPFFISRDTTTKIINNTNGFFLTDESNNSIVTVNENAPSSFDIFSNGDIGMAEGALYFDRSTRQLGIGTFTPADDLHIASSQPGILYDDTSASSADWYVGNFANDFIFHLVGNATGGPTGEIMTLDAQTGNIGMNQPAPQRLLHLTGTNAVFRMDRSVGTAAFMIVRTDGGGTPLKNFVLGTNATGSNNGEFIIDDYGTAVSGGGARRMTIRNDGTVNFNGTVIAPSFTQTSSRRFKDNIEQIEDPLALTQQLEGVRFNWKESGKPAVGFIAEDVELVLPEVVTHDSESGQVLGLNYSAIVPVLVEAIKAQQAEIAALQVQQAEFAALQTRLAVLEELVAANQSATVLAHN